MKLWGVYCFDGGARRRSKRVPDTVASERDDQMSETMIKNRNLPNPHLFEHFFYTRACHHPSPYYYLIFKAMGKPTWSTK